jgi:hypothetical protein
VLTINGRVCVRRIRWQDAQERSSTWIDAWLDEAERTVSQGARELICRLNQGSAGFRKTAANLRRAAQVESNPETIRHVDGAPWIRNQLELHGTVEHAGLEFCHFSEHVHTARRKVFGEEDADGSAWAEQLVHRAKHEGYSAAWEMAAACRWRATPSKREAVDRLGPDRGPVHAHNRAGQGLGQAVGQSQRRSGHGPGLFGQQPPVGKLLANPRPLNELGPPGSLGRPAGCLGARSRVT